MQNIHSKIRNLKHLINESDLNAIDALFANPEIEKEITNNAKFAYLGGEVRILHKKIHEAIEFLKQHLEKNNVNKQTENLKTLNTLGRHFVYWEL